MKPLRDIYYHPCARQHSPRSGLVQPFGAIKRLNDYEDGVYLVFRIRDGARVDSDLEMIKRILEEMALIAVRPMPLQYSDAYRNNSDVDWSKGAKKEHTRKLMAHYEKAGFRRVRGTGLMVLDPGINAPAVPSDDAEGYVRFQWQEDMEHHRIVRGAHYEEEH